MNTFATTASRDQDGAASKRYIRYADPKRVMNYLNLRKSALGGQRRRPSQTGSTRINGCLQGTRQARTLNGLRPAWRC